MLEVLRPFQIWYTLSLSAAPTSVHCCTLPAEACVLILLHRYSFNWCFCSNLLNSTCALVTVMHVCYSALYLHWIVLILCFSPCLAPSSLCSSRPVQHQTILQVALTGWEAALTRETDEELSALHKLFVNFLKSERFLVAWPRYMGIR